MQSQGPPRDSHVVPRFYLRRFADEHGRIRMFDKKAGVDKLVSVERVAVRPDFYRVETPTGLSDEVEAVLGAYEAAAARSMRGIDQGEFPLAGDSRTAVAVFIALQFARTPQFREATNQFATEFWRDEADVLASRTELLRGSWRDAHGADPTDADLDLMRSSLVSREFAVEASISEHVETMFEATDAVVEGLRQRAWVLIRSSDFWTGDLPVVFWRSRAGGVGIGNADEVFFPVSRSQALLLVTRPVRDHVVDVPRERLMPALERVWAAAARFTYRHPDTPLPTEFSPRTVNTWRLLP